MRAVEHIPFKAHGVNRAFTVSSPAFSRATQDAPHRLLPCACPGAAAATQRPGHAPTAPSAAGAGRARAVICHQRCPFPTEAPRADGRTSARAQRGLCDSKEFGRGKKRIPPAALLPEHAR